MRLLLTLFCSLLIVSGAAFAEPGGVVFGDIERKARAGDAEAQLEVGILYEFGYGMKGNKVPALAWYMLAADQGNPQAIERRDLLLKQLGKDQIEEARKLSLTLQAAVPKKKDDKAAPKPDTAVTPGESTPAKGADKPAAGKP